VLPWADRVAPLKVGRSADVRLSRAIRLLPGLFPPELCGVTCGTLDMIRWKAVGNIHAKVMQLLQSGVMQLQHSYVECRMCGTVKTFNDFC
jgi:hypothetical protein